MGGKLLGCEDVFAIGPGGIRIAIRLLKGIYHQGAVDFDRRFVLSLVEHHAAAETANRTLIGLRQHCVSPEGDDPVRLARLVFAFERPGPVGQGRRSQR